MLAAAFVRRVLGYRDGPVGLPRPADRAVVLGHHDRRWRYQARFLGSGTSSCLQIALTVLGLISAWRGIVEGLPFGPRHLA